MSRVKPSPLITQPLAQWKQACLVLLPLITCTFAWGRYNVLAALFLLAISFLGSKCICIVFLQNQGLRKRLSTLLALFAPAFAPFLAFLTYRRRDRVSQTVGSGADTCRSCVPSSPSLEQEIATLVDLIIRDYILFWYRVVSPDDEDFVLECRSTFNNMFTVLIREKLASVRLERLLPAALQVLRKHVERSAHDQEEKRRTQSADQKERAIAVSDEVARFILTSCGPATLAALREATTDASGCFARDSVFHMVKEMLVFGVIMPIACHLSSPALLFRSIISSVSGETPERESPASGHQDDGTLSKGGSEGRKAEADAGGKELTGKQWCDDADDAGVDGLGKRGPLSDPLTDPLVSLSTCDPQPKHPYADHVTTCE